MNLTLYFDGSCTKPGGTAGYGWRLLDNGKEVAKDSGVVCEGPEATNNVGEWGAVRNALRYLKQKNWAGRLEIIGDSQLVIYQLTGRYKCRKETLIPYYEECKLYLDTIEWSARWVPREENRECDELSKRTDTTSENPNRHRPTLGNRRRKNKGTPTDFPKLGEETPEVSFD